MLGEAPPPQGGDCLTGRRLSTARPRRISKRFGAVGSDPSAKNPLPSHPQGTRLTRTAPTRTGIPRRGHTRNFPSLKSQTDFTGHPRGGHGKRQWLGRGTASKPARKRGGSTQEHATRPLAGPPRGRGREGEARVTDAQINLLRGGRTLAGPGSIYSDFPGGQVTPRRCRRSQRRSSAGSLGPLQAFQLTPGPPRIHPAPKGKRSRKLNNARQASPLSPSPPQDPKGKSNQGPRYSSAGSHLSAYTRARLFPVLNLSRPQHFLLKRISKGHG